MNFKKALILFAGLLVIASPLLAQGTQTSTTPAGQPVVMPHRMDVILMGGYAWTISRNATIYPPGQPAVNGDFDIKDSGFWGIAADINVHPFAQLRLLYRRQDSDLTFKSRGTTDSGPMSVEYLHIGGIKGMVKGKVRPFGGMTLGGTRFNTDAGDEWKFSMMISLGAKIYMNEKIGIMLGGDLPISFTDAFLGIGTGGLSIGGTGITQLDLVGGIMILL